MKQAIIEAALGAGTIIEPMVQILEVCVLSVTIFVSGLNHGQVNIVTLPSVCRLSDDVFLGSGIVRGWRVTPEVRYEWTRGIVEMKVTTTGER